MRFQGAIIINNSYNEADINIQHKISRLEEEFKKLDTSIDVIKNNGDIAYIENGEIKLNIPSYDFVVYLDKDKYLARLLEKAGMKLFNNAEFLELCDDKMLTHIALANMNIPMPKTIPGPLVFKSTNGDDIKVMESVLKQLDFPFLIKGVYGSLGLNMAYIDSKETFLEEYKKMKAQPLLFQEYIESSRGRSIRCLVIDHKILGAFERCNPNDYRSNYHDGASSKSITLKPQYIELVNKVIKALDIDYAGVDLLYGEDDKPLLCEINSNAFFQEFEKRTGINAAKAFAEMIINRIK